jgi:deoxyribose-phosphate aldolase
MGADRRVLIACLDLTALGDDVDDDAVEALCARAARPLEGDPALHVAAVCLPTPFVSLARRLLADTPVLVAAATGGFPVPEAPLGERLDEIRVAVEAGAHEVDVPLNRFLIDEPDALVGELDATRDAAGGATWKAILETGALQPEEIIVLGRAATAAGADFLKTSTGSVQPGATPAAVDALARFAAASPRAVGIKVSGGVRGAGQAANYLDLVRAVLGAEWPVPSTFRIGASALLDALVA